MKKSSIQHRLEDELIDWKSESDMIANHPIYQTEKKAKRLKELSKQQITLKVSLGFKMGVGTEKPVSKD